MKKIVGLFLTAILCLTVTLSIKASEKMNVYALDGRSEVIDVSDFEAWHSVGWYSEPVMNVYALDGRSEIIKKADFEAWHSVGWYSEPVMYVYAEDGRKQIVTKREAPEWKTVGWDWQTDYADHIPFVRDDQYWAVIDLREGPYRDWSSNINYYIDKYFIEMPLEDRLKIKHYYADGEFFRSGSFILEAHYCYMIIPRYKTTNTVISSYTDWTTGFPVGKDGPVIAVVDNGLPFTVQVPVPTSSYWTVFNLKTYCNGMRGFGVGQNMSDLLGVQIDDRQILDLTDYFCGENELYAAYDEKLREYREAMKLDYDDFLVRYTDNSSINSAMVKRTYIYDTDIWYTLYDIDGNGIKEFILSDSKNIIDIYTIHDGNLIKLFENCSLGENDRVYVLESGLIFREGASSNASSFCNMYLIDASTGRLSSPLMSFYCGAGPNHYMDGYTYLYNEAYYEICNSYPGKSIFNKLYWNVIWS